jgi:hypothetical protein
MNSGRKKPREAFWATVVLAYPQFPVWLRSTYLAIRQSTTWSSRPLVAAATIRA